MKALSKLFVPVLAAGTLCIAGPATAADGGPALRVAQAGQSDDKGKGDVLRDRDRLQDQSCRDSIDKARVEIDRASRDCGPDRDRDRDIDRDTTRDRKSR